MASLFEQCCKASRIQFFGKIFDVVKYFFLIGFDEFTRVRVGKNKAQFKKKTIPKSEMIKKGQ